MDQVSNIINAIGKANSIGILSILAALLFLMVFMLLKKKRERRGSERAGKKLKSTVSRSAAKEKKRNKKDDKKTVQSTQSFAGVKAVVDGILVTADDRFIKVLEFYPINFLLKSVQEQDSIVESFAGFLRNCPTKVQIKSVATRTDVNKLLSDIQRDIEREENEYCKILLVEYMDFLKGLGSAESVSRRFYLIFEDDAPISYARDFESVKGRLNETAGTAIANINACGNIYIRGQSPDSTALELLYMLLNRRKSEMVPFNQYARETLQRYMDGYGVKDPSKVPYIPTSDLIAPKYISLQDSKFIVVDGKYYSFLYVTSDGYSPYVKAGWLSPLINACEGVDIDLFITREDSATVLNKIIRSIRMNQTRLNEVDDVSAAGNNIEDSISAGLYLRSGLLAGDEFHYISTLITISTDTADLLEARVEALTKALAAYGMTTRVCRFQQEQAFKSALPFCKLDRSIEVKSRRNCLTGDAASGYPFTSYAMCDEDGVLLGTNRENQSLVMLNNFNSSLYSNANMALMGASGKGKTFALQCIALRLRMKGIQVFTIAPLKGHEFKRACLAVGGQYVKISAGAPTCINILEIRQRAASGSDMVNGVGGDSLLANKVQQVKIFFSLLVPDMTLEERQLVDAAVMTAYERKGITMDNKSLEDPKHPGHYKEMPILQDVYDVMAEIPEAKRVGLALKTLVYGSAKSFNQQTNVNLDNKYIVLDISELTKETLLIGMFVALDYVWDKAKQDLLQRKAIILDELWKLIGQGSNTMAAEYVLEIFKIIRGYGGSAICATQDLNDFFALNGGEYGRGIINASSIKMIFGLENEEAGRVQECLNLTERETKAIREFDRGTALISTNGNNVVVDFKASELERKLITTDRKELTLLWQELNGDFQTPETEMLKDILSREG